MVDANDDFYADRAALIMPGPVRASAEFGYRGKVYDGWETRRRRELGSDYAIIRLGVPGIVRGVVIATTYFRGNYPPEISVQATALEDFPARPSWPPPSGPLWCSARRPRATPRTSTTSLTRAVGHM